MRHLLQAWFKRAAVWLPTFGLCGTLTSSFASFGEGTRQSIFVSLAPDEPRALLDLKELKGYDLAGVQWERRRAELILNPREISEVMAKGFAISFADELYPNEQQSVEGYTTPDGVVAALTALADSNPSKVKLLEIGQTTRGRPILAVEISSRLGDPDLPVVLFNGMHHAREVMTTEVLLHMAQTLVAEASQKSGEAKAWLDAMRIVIVPQVNPDGNALVHQGQNMWRKNGWVREQRTTGVDLNRNYPAYWNHCQGSSGSFSSETYRGPSPSSEPETKALMNLVATYKPVANLSYHSYGEMIIYPYGCTSVPNLAQALFKSVGNQIKSGLVDDAGRTNTYRLGTAPQLLYEADGTDLDWQWREHGVLAYTIEMNGQGFQPSFERWRQLTVERQEGGWRALLSRMVGGGVRLKLEGADLEGVRLAVTPLTQVNAVDLAKVRWGVRSPSGLVYQLLDPGSYRLDFYRGEEHLSHLDVEVGEGVRDAGVVRLEH